MVAAEAAAAEAAAQARAVEARTKVVAEAAASVNPTYTKDAILIRIINRGALAGGQRPRRPGTST